MAFAILLFVALYANNLDFTREIHYNQNINDFAENGMLYDENTQKKPYETREYRAAGPDEKTAADEFILGKHQPV